MIHKNLTPFFWGPRVTARKPRELELAVCVRGVFRLAPGAPLEVIEDPIEQGFMSGDTFAEDDIDQTGPLLHASDFADWKMHGEYLVRGSCHPAGGPATSSAARVTIGDRSKTVQVLGPRAYKKGLLLGGSAGEPQPFAAMPLTWQNAYGGAGYADNPAGRGYVGEELPTVELPDAPVKKVGQRDVTPATFLPISPHWRGRAGKRGKNYGAAWKKTHAPFYSDDFDWTYFQSAPQDQWNDGYWRGDERMTFENLHPDAPSWSATLPGIRLRAFVKTADGRVHEPEMNLDTVFADVEDGKLELTWRGHSPITQLDMADVVAVLIAQEALADEPGDAQPYLDQLAEFEADPVGLKTAFPAGFMAFAAAIDEIEQAQLHDTPMPDVQKLAEDLPEDCPFPPWFLAGAAGDEDPIGVKDAFPPGMLDGDPAMGQGGQVGGLADPAAMAKLQEDVAKLADDPGLAPEVLKALTALLPPDQQANFQEGIGVLESQMAEAKAAAGDDVFTNAAKAAKQSPQTETMAQSYDGMMSSANAEVAAGVDGATTQESLAAAKKAQANLGEAPQTLDEAVARSLEPLDDVELPELPELPDTEADLAAMSKKLETDEARMREKFGDHPMLGMFAMGRAMIENAPRPADVVPDMSAFPAAMSMAEQAFLDMGVSAAAIAPLTALKAKVCALLDQLPQPAPLPEGEFVARDLRGRDFSGQDLSGQCFRKSDLTGAKFVGATLTGCDFTKADLTKADLSGATLSDATFKSATLTKAVLAKATGHRTVFADAELGGADLTGAGLEGAKLTSCRAQKARLGEARLPDADLRFADLSKADLRAADLRRADLSFATIDLAKADGVDLSGANLDIARLTKSRLHGARLRGARCNMGQLTASNLSDADLGEVSFEKVDLMKCVLDRADLRHARLSQSQLRDVTATKADFRHADLGGCSTTGEARLIDCDFRHAVGARSVWMGADLTGSTFRHADLAHAFFDGATGADVDFTAAILGHANFRKASLTRTSFACADLASAVFQDASLDDADFQRSNCYDAKFLGARAVRCRFEKAFLVATQLDDPDRQTPGEAGR